MDVAYGNVSTAISAVLPKLHKSGWTATSSSSTKSTGTSSGPISNGLGDAISGKDHARESKLSASEDKDVSLSGQSATSTALQSRASNARVQVSLIQLSACFAVFALCNAANVWEAEQLNRFISEYLV